MNNVYKALADPSRRKILEILRQGDLSAGEIAEHFDFSKPTLSQHLRVLREADLIHGDKDGNRIIYHLNLSVLEEALMEMLSMFKIDPPKEDNQ